MQSKLKVYLDTSVISYLEQKERGEKHNKTLALWDLFKKNLCYVFISNQVIAELRNCSIPTQIKLSNKIKEIQYKILSTDNLSLKIEKDLQEKQILNNKSLADCTHIAIAIANDCDYILSWNFRHFVKEKTKNGVDMICKELKLKVSKILSPVDFLEIIGGAND